MPTAFKMHRRFNGAAPAANGGSLTACEVSYRAGNKLLLDRVSVQVEPGKILAVVGPNGAGKTTLLRLLSGELAPQQGELQLDGRSLNRWTSVERAQRIAVLPQQSTFNANLTALETTLLGRSPHHARRNGESSRRIAQEALAAVNASHLTTRLYPSLSGGEKSRVQTARVMAQIWEDDSSLSRFLLLDEPTAALDCAHQHRLLADARRFAQRNVGVLAVLHDLNLASQYADRVLIMATGQVMATGSPNDVFQPKLLSAVFGIELSIISYPKIGWPLVVPDAQTIYQSPSHESMTAGH